MSDIIDLNNISKISTDSLSNGIINSTIDQSNNNAASMVSFLDDANNKKDLSASIIANNTTATTAAPYIIQNGNIYQLTSNNQLISRNSIQVNQVNNNLMPATKQTININAPSLLNQNNVSLNILNSKLINTNKNIKVTTLKNGAVLNINSLPSTTKNRIIFKTPINLASDYQLKTPKQVLIVPNTNNSNIQHIQQQNINSTNEPSMTLIPINNGSVIQAATARPVKSPQQTVQYYLSNNFNNINNNNNNANVINITNLNQELNLNNNSNIKIAPSLNQNQIDLNKTITLLPPINTNAPTTLPVSTISNQQIIQAPIQQQNQPQQLQPQIYSVNVNNQLPINNSQSSINADCHNKNNLITALNNTTIISSKTVNEANSFCQNAKSIKAQPNKIVKSRSQSITKVKNSNLPSTDQQQLHQQNQQTQSIKQIKLNEVEPKNNEQSNSPNDIDALLNEIMLPDTRIFASLLSKDFNNNNSIPSLTFPENSSKNSAHLNELTYKTLIIGNSEHIILDNPNNLSDFRGSFEKLKSVAIALANKLNKPVSVPAFLVIDDENALENVKETLSQKNINPILIETTNNLNSSNENINNNSNSNNGSDQTSSLQSTKTTPTSIGKKRTTKSKNGATSDDQTNSNTVPPAKKRAYNFMADHKSIKKSLIKQEQIQSIQTNTSVNFDNNNISTTQTNPDNNINYTNNSSETNAQVESIINNIKSSLLASQNQNQTNSNSNFISQMNNNLSINNENNNKNLISNNNESNNEIDLNCYSLDANSLFNLSLNNIEWIA